MKRVAHYERAHEPLPNDSEHSYIKLIDVGRQFIMNRLYGYLQSRMAFFLINLHTQPRVIYLSRHGESEYNVTGRIGGDPNLSPRGRAYADALARWMRKNGPERLKVWTSTLRRTRQTGAGLEDIAHGEVLRWRALDEINSGVCEGLSYEEIQEKMPEEFARRDADKYRYSTCTSPWLACAFRVALSPCLCMSVPFPFFSPFAWGASVFC